jgi:hypothetical protein
VLYLLVGHVVGLYQKVADKVGDQQPIKQTHSRARALSPPGSIAPNGPSTDPADDASTWRIILQKPVDGKRACWILDVATGARRFDDGAATETNHRTLFSGAFEPGPAIHQVRKKAFRDYVRNVSTGSLHRKADPGIKWSRVSGGGKREMIYPRIRNEALPGAGEPRDFSSGCG